MSCTYTVGQHTSDCDHFTYHCPVAQQKRLQSPVSNYTKQLWLKEYNDQCRKYVHRNQQRLAHTVKLQSTHLSRSCIVLYKNNVPFFHSSNCSSRCISFVSLFYCSLTKHWSPLFLQFAISITCILFTDASS